MISTYNTIYLYQCQRC